MRHIVKKAFASIGIGLSGVFATPSLAQDAAAPEPISQALMRWEALLRDHFSGLLEAIPRLPAEFARGFSVAGRDLNEGRPGLVFAIIVGLIAFSYLVETGIKWALADRSGATSPVDQSSMRPYRAALSETTTLLVSAVASISLFVVFEWPPLLRKVVLTFLAAFFVFRLVRSATRLVLAGDEPVAPGDDMVSLPPDRAAVDAFWLRRVSLFAGILLFGWAFVSMMWNLHFSEDVRRLVAYAFGLGLLAVAIDIVWRRPAAVLKSPRRKSLLTLYLIALWLLWVLGLNGLFWLGVYALLLRQVVSGVGRISRAYVGSLTSLTWKAMLAKVLIERGARAVVIVAAVAWLLTVSRFNISAVSDDSIASRILYGIFNATVVLLIADLVWSMAKAFIDHRVLLAEQVAADGSEELARAGRLRTLLPLVRNSLGVIILATAAMTVLAGLGVQIAPLIAGAGIFGVAIGFGSQTLVKDILSGVFYMFDDAFRVGEYIQSGNYKGTVESFSLRSVRLRHHRGPIYTVPFGELGAVQNMSRDWVIEKWTIGVTYDTDVDKARKIIKNIGIELSQDPEYASSTLEPLKMQGVDSFGEFAIVLKLKLMTKPGQQFSIKRKAFVMIKKAFEENGIRIAVPTVEVSGQSGADTAVAKQVTRRRRSALAAQAAAQE